MLALDRLTNRTAFVAPLLVFAFTAAAADLRGTWQGTWTKNRDALPVVVNFEGTSSGFTGFFDSDALQVADIPFGTVKVSGDAVSFTLEGDATTAIFHGVLAQNSLAGTFVDGATHGTFALARAKAPPATVNSRDVTFRDGDITLAGTLLSPPAPGKHPAILFLQGSGPEGRWANRYLAEKFTQAGFVALVYDKRGVGQSTGDWRNAGFDALADDAAAGIRFLQFQSAVDPARTGIYGHSQGGTMAPLVVERGGNLAFVIASAAGGIAPADLEIFSVGNSIGISALPPAERRDAETYVREVVDVAYRGDARATLDAMTARFKDRSWFFPPPPPDNSYWTLSRKFAQFDPPPHWRRVKSPVLLLYGDRDERTPPGASIEAIGRALREAGNTHVTIRIFPGADHTFMLVDLHDKGGWPKHVANYAQTLTDWAVSQTIR
jgi:dipeptidyl aminopeptidase/acylaminoacyl peptidase